MSAGLAGGPLSALMSALMSAQMLDRMSALMLDRMSALMPALSPGFVASLGWALLHFVWQGALIGCATAVLLLGLRNARPERRYAVACAALLLCIAWPAVDFALMLRDGRDVQAARLLPLAQAPAAILHDATGMFAWLQRHLAWIVGAWAACATALALRMALGLVWVGRASLGRASLGRASPRRALSGQADTDDAAASDEERIWQARLSHLADRCGIGRRVRLRIVGSLASPVTAGWWRPVVLVPAALVTGMPPQLLEALLAHELGHVHRHDYLVNLVQNVIEALLFYHPAVWWISRRIRQEREQIADDFAARRLGEPRRLARALSELERLQFSHHHLAQAASGGDLMARIRRLLRADPQALDWRAAIPVLGLVLACAASAHALSVGDGTGSRPTGAAANLSRPAIADFTSCRKPTYPQADIAAEHEGTVTMNFLVDTDGTVADSRLLRSSGFSGLDTAAQTALRQCRFSPALRHGQPVRSWTGVQYVWKLL
jgi:D-alanyl-D-alanine endopeptidase (penicillin-binding protein 7)